MDRFENNLSKKDASLALINKVIAEQTVKKIETLYGPFSDEEIMFYRKKLIKDGKPVINSFQKKLVGYLFFKEFVDPISTYAINQIDYIKLLIAGKRYLLHSGMVILPYIISSRVTRIATRKNVNNKELLRIQSSELYEQVKAKYNNPKIELKILEIIGQVISSQFEIIDYNDDLKQPTEIDGQPVPIINDIINEELMFFICMI